MKSNNPPQAHSAPVFLLGFMCSGKTTLGKAVAQACGATFVDIDQYIESARGMSIKEIFNTMGEDAFREMERASLIDIISKAKDSAKPTIVACGGGTPCFFDNIDMMNAAGTTVWLQPRNEQVLLGRLRDGRATRPLLRDMDDSRLLEYAREMQQKRACHYGRAQHTFDSSRLDSPEQIKTSVDSFISQFL